MNALLKLFDFSSAEYLPNLKEGALVLFIGIATVFAVLTIILAILSLFNVFFGNKPRKDAPAPAPVASAPVAAPAASSEDEIVAVIAAAIAAAESECSGSKFRVVSFKRK